MFVRVIVEGVDGTVNELRCRVLSYSAVFAELRYPSGAIRYVNRATGRINRLERVGHDDLERLSAGYDKKLSSVYESERKARDAEQAKYERACEDAVERDRAAAYIENLQAESRLAEIKDSARRRAEREAARYR